MDRDSNICAGRWLELSNGRRILHIHLQILVQIFFNYTRTRYISSLILSIKFKNVLHERKRKKEKDIVYESTKFFKHSSKTKRERIGMFDRWIEFTPPGAWHAADGPDTRSDIPVSYFSRVFLPAILWLIVFEYSKGHAPLPVRSTTRVCVRGCSLLLLFSFSFSLSTPLFFFFFFSFF